MLETNEMLAVGCGFPTFAFTLRYDLGHATACMITRVRYAILWNGSAA